MSDASRADQASWRRCSACKGPIALGATYWVCSVSTCNQSRTALVFCSVSCWDAHLPVARHREAWAEERLAPARREPAPAPSAASSRRRLVRPGAPASPTGGGVEEILVVGSRLKEYVRVQSGYNTSDRVLRALSAIVRRACDEAIRNAQREGRRTVLERDVPDV